MFLGYLLHENHLTETIERTIGIVEDIEHHVAQLRQIYKILPKGKLPQGNI